MASRTFTSRDWMGPALAAGVVLLGLMTRPSFGESLVLVALATCLLCGACGRRVLASRRYRHEDTRARALRKVFAAQVVVVVTVWAMLVLLAQTVLAISVIAVGAALTLFAWPWSWRLAQAAEDRERAYDDQLARQHLIAAGILAVLAIGSAIALSPVAAAMLSALVVSSMADSWNERRRRRFPGGVGDVAPSRARGHREAARQRVPRSSPEVPQQAPPEVLFPPASPEVDPPAEQPSVVLDESAAAAGVPASTVLRELDLETTMLSPPIFEPLDLPEVPVTPAPLPEPEPYRLFADEVELPEQRQPEPESGTDRGADPAPRRRAGGRAAHRRRREPKYSGRRVASRRD